MGMKMSLWKRNNLSLIVDWSIFIPMMLICAIGLITLYSAGMNYDTQQSVPMQKQAAFMVAGLGFFIFCNWINVQVWNRLAWVLYGLGCILLIVLIVKGVVAGGARRWLDFGVLRFQPSEFTKLALIITLARYFSSPACPDSGHSFKDIWKPLGIIAVVAILIFDQPDLGTAMCHVLIGGTMLWLSGIRLRVISVAILSAVLLAVPVWEFALKDYQKLRVINFLSPESDPLHTGYHAIQSKIAVGSGGMMGKGFLNGSQTQLRFLPEQTTDFIFSVFAEEWGFWGVSIVLLLYGLLVLSMVRSAQNTPDRFSCYVVFGVAAMIFWHVLINIGMVSGVVPVVGITLPIFSYGGSSVLIIMGSLGVASSIGRRKYYFRGAKSVAG